MRARYAEHLSTRREHGFTKVRQASNDVLLRRLLDEGDKPGTLWSQGLLEGASPR